MDETELAMLERAQARIEAIERTTQSQFLPFGEAERLLSEARMLRAIQRRHMPRLLAAARAGLRAERSRG